MLTNYNRPGPPSPPLLYVGGQAPMLTSASAYQMIQSAEDLQPSKPISGFFAKNMSAAAQTYVSGGANLLAQASELLELFADLNVLKGNAWAGNLVPQIQEQLQPGQAVEVVISNLTSGHPSIEIGEQGSLHSKALGEHDDDDTVVLHVQKPGPGDLECLVPNDSVPVTTVFHLKDPLDTTVRMDTSQLKDIEKPVEQSVAPNPPVERQGRAAQNQDKKIVVP